MIISDETGGTAIKALFSVPKFWSERSSILWAPLSNPIAFSSSVVGVVFLYTTDRNSGWLACRRDTKKLFFFICYPHLSLSLSLVLEGIPFFYFSHETIFDLHSSKMSVLQPMKQALSIRDWYLRIRGRCSPPWKERGISHRIDRRYKEGEKKIRRLALSIYIKAQTLGLWNKVLQAKSSSFPLFCFSRFSLSFPLFCCLLFSREQAGDPLES